MMDYQEAIENHIKECRHRIDIIRNHMNTNGDADKGVCNKNIEVLEISIHVMQELQQYKRLGTLEEVREAVEKQQDKKIEIWNGQAMCPKCNALFGNMNDIKKLIAWEMPNCKFCGQKLDWSEEDD